MSTAAQPTDSDEITFAAIVRLSRFLRGTYGVEAANEAQRRTKAYTRDAQYKLAELWTLVLMHLRGTAVTDETHRIVKVRKRLTVKSAPVDAA